MRIFKRFLHAFTPIRKGILEPHIFASVQTDGSFRKNISRTAILLNTTEGEQYRLVNTYFDHANSNESEWCSVLDGLDYSLQKNQKSLLLENDNLGVIQSLIRQKPQNSCWEYYDSIYEILESFDWVSVRWIPRELNRADKLFRL
jgi:ribonuclease HI